MSSEFFTPEEIGFAKSLHTLMVRYKVDAQEDPQGTLVFTSRKGSNIFLTISDVYDIVVKELYIDVLGAVSHGA